MSPKANLERLTKTLSIRGSGSPVIRRTHKSLYKVAPQNHPHCHQASESLDLTAKDGGIKSTAMTLKKKKLVPMSIPIRWISSSGILLTAQRTPPPLSQAIESLEFNLPADYRLVDVFDCYYYFYSLRPSLLTQLTKTTPHYPRKGTLQSS